MPSLQISPDHKWVLNAINVSDGKVRQLNSFAERLVGRAVWMPDGDSLVVPVSETPLGRRQLWSIDYPGGQRHRFTNDLSDYTPDLDLTHDGKMLAGIQHTQVSDVWTVPAADSTQARQITSGETPYVLIAPGPAGKLLARTSSGDLWLMNADGSERAVLVPQAFNILSISSCSDRYVVFDRLREAKLELWRADDDGSNGAKLATGVASSDCSPDGTRVFYAADDNKIYRVSPEGGASIEVLAVPGLAGAGSLTVSPDENLVAFTYQEGSPVPLDKLAVVPASGGTPHFVCQLPISANGLRWSPSGKALQYRLTRNGASNIWEQPLAGGPPRQITNFTSGLIFAFAWSRDGNQLLLAKGNESSDVILISNFR